MSATSAAGSPVRVALVPDFVQPARDLRDPRLHIGLVALAQIFQADVDDPARVDDVIGRIDDAAIVDPLAFGAAWPTGCWRRPRPPCSARGRSPRGQDRAERVGADDIDILQQDRVGRYRGGAQFPASASARAVSTSASDQLRAVLRQQLAPARRRPSRRPASRRERPRMSSLPSARFAAAFTPR